MEKPTPKQLYNFVNSDDFTREHLSAFVAAILEKEWADYMEDDLNILGYNMTVDESTAWKVDQGLISYDMHESISEEEELEPIRSCGICGGRFPLCWECHKVKEGYVSMPMDFT